MATGFTIPTAITKRSKVFSTIGVVTNDVIYTCPANCVTDLYLENLSHGQIGQTFNLTSIKMVRAGGPVPAVVDVCGAQSVGNGTSSLVMDLAEDMDNAKSNAIAAAELPTIVSSATDGTAFKVGSVVRMFPGDYILANYTNINAPGTQLDYSTIESFGQ